MKASVTISRCSDNTVRIAVRDEASRIEFVELSMSLEAFGSVVTGLGARPAEMDVRGLEHVGKKQVTERREVLCPLCEYNRRVLQEWLWLNAQEDGYTLNSYLGSQDSVQHTENGTLLRYSVTKYVDESDG